MLLLNSDTIVKEHALDSLVEFMDSHPRAGIAGSKMLWPDDQIRASPFRFLGVASEFDRGLKLGIVSSLLSRWAAVPPTPKEPEVVEWVSGASMMLRSTTLREIGLLDEGLYTYFDDVDICLRARNAGWQTWYVPASRVIHLGGSSTGVSPKISSRRPAYWFQARRRYFLKSYGKAYTALADAAFILGLSLRRLRQKIHHKPDHRPAEVPGRLHPTQRLLHRIPLDRSRESGDEELGLGRSSAGHLGPCCTAASPQSPG